MYLKSKALLESRRKCRLIHRSCFAIFCSVQLENLILQFNTVVMEYYSFTEPHTKDIDVFLKRDIETGFGFRVLGGEGPQQPVSIYSEIGTLRLHMYHRILSGKYVDLDILKNRFSQLELIRKTQFF